MQKFKPRQVAQTGNNAGDEINIIKRRLQRSINYYFRVENSVDPKSGLFDFGKKVSAYNRCYTALTTQKTQTKTKTKFSL